MTTSISELKRLVPEFFAQRPPPRMFHIRNKPLKASRLRPPFKSYVFEYDGPVIRAAWEHIPRTSTTPHLLVKLRPSALRTFIKDHFFEEYQHQLLRSAKRSNSSITIMGQTFDWS